MKRNKLKLNRETVRLLEPQLHEVHGGRANQPTDQTSIHLTCYTCVSCQVSCGGTCVYTCFAC